MQNSHDITTDKQGLFILSLLLSSSLTPLLSYFHYSSVLQYKHGDYYAVLWPAHRVTHLRDENIIMYRDNIIYFRIFMIRFAKTVSLLLFLSS